MVKRRRTCRTVSCRGVWPTYGIDLGMRQVNLGEDSRGYMLTGWVRPYELD